MTNDDTLLYGVEVKFYSARVVLTNQLETKLRNVFATGTAPASRAASRRLVPAVSTWRARSSRACESRALMFMRG